MGASVSSQNFGERLKEPGTGAAILIADDDPAIRLVLRHRLEADGYRVDEAVDSASALAALRSNRVDVALLDIIMPGNGGLDVLSAAHSETVRTLIIVITAAKDADSVRIAMQGGALHYLLKPFSFPVLRDKMLSYAQMRTRLSTLREADQRTERSPQPLAADADRDVARSGAEGLIRQQRAVGGAERRRHQAVREVGADHP